MANKPKIKILIAKASYGMKKGKIIKNRMLANSR
jgi:hypothetical protein